MALFGYLDDVYSKTDRGLVITLFPSDHECVIESHILDETIEDLPEIAYATFLEIVTPAAYEDHFILAFSLERVLEQIFHEDLSFQLVTAEFGSITVLNSSQQENPIR